MFQEGPRVLREAIKRPSRRLQRRCCDSDPISTAFGTRKGSPGTSKNKEFCKTSYRFRDFGLLPSSRLRDPILDPLGLRFGSLLAVKTAETSLGIPLGALQSRSKALFSGSGGLQEPSKTPPRGLQVAKSSKSPPISSRIDSGVILGHFGGTSWSYLGVMLGQVWLHGRRQMSART